MKRLETLDEVVKEFMEETIRLATEGTIGCEDAVRQIVGFQKALNEFDNKYDVQHVMWLEEFERRDADEMAVILLYKDSKCTWEFVGCDWERDTPHFYFR